jgi:hypothetical protein
MDLRIERLFAGTGEGWRLRHMTGGLVLTLLAVALFGFAAAHAQPPACSPAPAAVDGAARAAVVHAAARQLKDGYVFPDVGGQAAETLESALAAGSYDALNDPVAFAARLTADLSAVAHDKHLQVVAGCLVAPPPGAAAAPRSEGGVARADRLAGNIGYIEIVSFPPADFFKPPLDRAMAALAQTRALIIDARRHAGGMADALDYLESYFLPKGAAAVALGRGVWRNPGTDTFRTVDSWSVPTPFSYAGKPVYVLTSSQTVSGGEALAAGLRALGHYKIVGETTVGAAHPGGMVPVGTGFAMFLPVGRPENRDDDWEGVGVKPDIAVPAADALQVALQQLGQKPSAAGIDALSQTQLFTPRTTAQPGSEAAVRRVIEELRRGEPNYNLLAHSSAEFVRGQLAFLHDMFTKLGAVEAVTFVEVDLIGNSVYSVQLANGAVRAPITLTPDGRSALAGFRLTQAPQPKP